jgi:transcriptional regulator of arginine metabolism
MNEYPDRSAPQRHEAIARIIRARPIRSQEELRHALGRLGFRVAQPTLSRDVRQLGLAKTPRGYVAPDLATARFAPAETRRDKLDRVLRGFALSARAAGALVVVKTPPAAAQPVARALDEAPLPAIVGTIAGDDTVFVATVSERAARQLCRRLLASLGGRPSEVSA